MATAGILGAVSSIKKVHTPVGRSIRGVSSITWVPVGEREGLRGQGLRGRG